MQLQDCHLAVVVERGPDLRYVGGKEMHVRRGVAGNLYKADIAAHCLTNSQLSLSLILLTRWLKCPNASIMLYSANESV